MQKLTEKQQRTWNTLPLATAVIALLRVSACSSKFLTTTKPDNTASTLATTKTATSKSLLKPTSNISTPLSDIGKYSKAIYDTAKKHDWTTAAVQLAFLQNASELHPGFKTDKDAAQFHTSIVALDIAVAAKERSEAMHRANQLILITANTATQFKPSLPVEVKLLEYQGRELEVWALAKNVVKLKTTSSNIHRTWDALRPLVNAQGAKVLSQKFSNLVLCIDAAKSTNEYSHLANSFLEAVDNLEKIFQK